MFVEWRARWAMESNHLADAIALIKLSTRRVTEANAAMAVTTH